MTDQQNLLTTGTAYTAILDNIASKSAAGFIPTLIHLRRRLLSYQLLNGNDGGVSDTLSGLTALLNFTSFNVTFPTITSLGVKTFQGECLPGPNATQYELHPTSSDHGIPDLPLSPRQHIWVRALLTAYLTERV
jgi:lysophospholipase